MGQRATDRHLAKIIRQGLTGHHRKGRGSDRGLGWAIAVHPSQIRRNLAPAAERLGINPFAPRNDKPQRRRKPRAGLGHLLDQNMPETRRQIGHRDRLSRHESNKGANRFRRRFLAHHHSGPGQKRWENLFQRHVKA